MLIDPYTWHTATIVEIIRESDNAVSIRVDTKDDYTILAGQHAVVRTQLTHDIRLMRQYSFSSAPRSHEIWFTIVKTDGGSISSWYVDHAQVGDTIDISQPFTGPLQTDIAITNTRIHLIGGGSGIAPLMSIVRERRQRGISATTVIYSTRSNERCFVDELIPHDDEAIHIRDTHTTHRITATEIETWCLDGNHIFICGSRQFVDDMRKTIADLLPSAMIYSEAFSLV